MSKKHEFKTDDTAYLPSGQEVSIVEKLERGYVVQFVYDAPGGEAPQYGELRVHVGDLFPEPPVARFAPETEALRAETAALRKSITELRKDRTAEVAARAGLIQKLAQVPALKRIEDILDGKITHVVVRGWRKIEIIPFAEFKVKEDYDRRGLFRLISLYGRSAGDLNWEVNRYSDGSGSWEHIVPCTSVEEAAIAAREWLERDRPGKPEDWTFWNVREYLKWGLVVPEEAKTRVLEKLRASCQAALDKAKKDADEAQKKLDLLSARHGDDPDDDGAWADLEEESIQAEEAVRDAEKELDD